jgi:hypothetical protein
LVEKFAERIHSSEASFEGSVVDALSLFQVIREMPDVFYRRTRILREAVPTRGICHGPLHTRDNWHEAISQSVRRASAPPPQDRQ